MAKQLSKLCFVPVQIPVDVEFGGHVVWRSDIARFCDVLDYKQGALGFSVMPLLEQDIAPFQMWHSALGVTSEPPIEKVTEHLMNLTGHGKG